MCFVALLTACDEKTSAPTPTPTPLAGWDRARWGMTASEIQTAYPAAMPHKTGGLIMFTGTTIAGCDFTVRFLLDNSGKLTEVLLSKEFDKEYSVLRAIHAKQAYDEVKELLVQKYLRPAIEEPEKPDSITRKAVWHVSNTRISLVYIVPSGNRAPVIGVNYGKPGDTDKL